MRSQGHLHYSRNRIFFSLIFPANKLLDLIDTQYQLIKNGFNLGDVSDLALFEMDMMVMVVAADKERNNQG